jgi:hypothetical protein
MKNLVKNFNSFINEKLRRSDCCGAKVVEGVCESCGVMIDLDDESLDGDSEDLIDPTFEAKKPNRKAVLKAAEEKYPNRSAESMQKSLKKMPGKDFKEKAKKNFDWADDPNAAAAAFIRKATKKEPRDV